MVARRSAGLGAHAAVALSFGVLSACATGRAGQQPPVVASVEETAETREVDQVDQVDQAEVGADKPTTLALNVAPSPAPPPGGAVDADVVTTPPALVIKAGFAAPAAVLHDAASDVYLVSNRNGPAAVADDNGFISRVSPDGQVLELKWIDGAREEIELNAPEGMAVAGEVLYVADLDRIRKFDVHSGAVLGAIEVQGASLLSGVSAAPDGTLYCTDAGVRAAGEALERTGTDAIYELIADEARPLTRGKQLNEPQAIQIDSTGVWVVASASNELYDVKSGKKSKAQQLPVNALDGIVRANDGRWYVSGGDSDQILVGRPGGEFEVAYELSSPAGLGYDATRNWLLIPSVRDNAVKLQPL